MDLKKVHARDRRGAAVHEAGHVVIARHFGCRIASAWIIPADDPAPNERTWIGRAQYQGVPADPAKRRMIGLAGEVAEHLWRGGVIEDFSPDDAMSDSDWRCAGYEPHCVDDALEEAAHDVSELLAMLWAELIREARRLIVEARRL